MGGSRRERERGKKERRLGFPRLRQYFEELLNKASYIHLAHPLALLRKQQLPRHFVKWLMLQVKQYILTGSFPSDEVVLGQACAELLHFAQDEEFFLIYQSTTPDRTPVKSGTFIVRQCIGFLEHTLITLNPLKFSFRHTCPFLSLLAMKQVQLMIL